MAIYWLTPGFNGRTFKLRVLTRWDFNFCVRSSPLRGVNQKMAHGKKKSTSQEAYTMHAFVIHQWKQNKIFHFRTLTLKKKKNTDKSPLCAVCPYEVKKKTIDYNLSTKNYNGKHLLSIPSPYQLKKNQQKNHIGLQTEHVCDNTNFFLKFLYFQLAENTDEIKRKTPQIKHD